MTLMAWDLESLHVLVHETISRRRASISQTWNPSRTYRTPRGPPGQKGVLLRHLAQWCSRLAEEDTRRLQLTKVWTYLRLKK